MKPFMIRLDDETRAALERAAADDQRPVSAMARLILVAWLRSKGYLTE